jgi:hypothetical protein
MLSHSLVTLFPFCHFHIHLSAIESLVRGQLLSGNDNYQSDLSPFV